MQQTELLLRCKLLKGFGYQKLLQLAGCLPGKLNDLTLRQILELDLPPGAEKAVRVAFSNRFDRTVARILCQCQVISYFDDIYPPQLREIYRPPLVLFAQGNLQLLQKEIVAIVGSRTPTEYSREVIQKIVPKLTKDNWVIASGLAKGVDGLAHQAALEAGAGTIAVVGNGLNYYYPIQNRNLQEKILKKGLLLSEYLPDTPPRPFRFPERNRIIAGLSQNLIVTEAKKHSGSLITANLALDDNRNIYAVPGPVSSPLSVGPNELIAAGATPIVDLEMPLRNI